MLLSVQTQDMKDQIVALAAFGKKEGLDYTQYGAYYLGNTTIDINSNLRQWTYQYCSEFGFFQTPRNDTYAMRSQLLRIDYWPDYCQRVFNKRISNNNAATNKLYGGVDIKGHNIVFANAEEDPWQWAGMRELGDPEHQQTMTAHMINCEDCGHCIDFHTPTDTQPIQLTEVQQAIAVTINEWLTSSKQL